MLILASSLVLVFALGLGTLLAQGTTPTLEPWQSTLTAIMVNKTAYAELYPSPTTTPTLASIAAQTPQPITLDPLELTATYIVGQATDQTAIEYTETANAIFGFSISQDAVVPPTFTPIPTYTVAELTQQKTAYINKLTKTVGFSYPIFDEIANSLLVEEVLANHYLTLDELELDTQSVSFGNSKYVVLVVYGVGTHMSFSRILLFRVSDQEPVMLENPSTISSDLFVYIGLNPFADVNGNGLPDMPVYSSYGGSCCPPQLHILEIKPNREIVDITPETDEVYPARLIDLNDDGVLEIQTQNPSPGLSSWIYLVRWFGWNGKDYVDISSQHPELYLSQINLLEQGLFSPERCNRGYFAVEVENYLVNFYAMGRLSDGWSELQRLLKLHCSTDDLQKAEGVLKDVEEWMNSLPKS